MVASVAMVCILSAVMPNPAPRIPLRISYVPRTPFFAGNDDQLGQTLLDNLTRRLPRGVPRPVMFLLRPDLVHVVDLPPLLRPGTDIHRTIASFAGLEEVEALALVGVLIHRQPVERRLVSVFIEWTDCRWWAAWQPIDNQTRALEGNLQIARAVDGRARPRGFGNWFSRARFQGLRATLEPTEPGPTQLMN